MERHRSAATVVTSNREPIEWLGLMADPLLAQSAIDRLQSAAYELVTRELPANCIAAGVPARVLGWRQERLREDDSDG